MKSFAAFAVLIFVTPAFAVAGDLPSHTYNIQPQDLGSALKSFAFQSKREIFFAPELIRGKLSHGVSGKYEDLFALETILRDTGLSYTVTASKAILVKGPAKPAEDSIPASHSNSEQPL